MRPARPQTIAFRFRQRGVGLAAALGLVLAWRYWRTRSLWLVWLEHALWGNFIFTIGLGHYFLTALPLK